MLLLIIACVDDVRTQYTITFGDNPTEQVDIPTESSWDKGEDDPGIVEDGWCELTDPSTGDTVKPPWFRLRTPVPSTGACALGGA